MIKKMIFVSLVSMVAALSLVGCGNSDDNNNSVTSTRNNSNSIVSSADSYVANDGFMNESGVVSDPLDGIGNVVSDIGQGISSAL